MNTFKYNYKTTLPKQANAPSVTIDGALFLEYTVSFYVTREDGYLLIKKIKCKTGETVYANSHQWFDNWYITIHLGDKLISHDTFDPTGKVVFIKMDAYALGDNIAWVEYVEEFRKIHNCIVICSTFFNDLFLDIYPNILFVKPNTNIDNVYAQYYIGATNEENSLSSPIKVNENPLQFVASKTLGLSNQELRPKLETKFNKINNQKKYVCISEHASGEQKKWKFENGWQIIVDYLISYGYDVIAISKEPTNLNNVIDMTGDKSISERANMLLNADFFIGVSSGLAWLSWAVGTHVIMISDVTPINHEFKTNITRLSANKDLDTVDFNTVLITTAEEVITKINNIIY